MLRSHKTQGSKSVFKVLLSKLVRKPSSQAILVDPSNLTAETKVVLESLLKNNPEEQFFDALNIANNKPVTYLVPVTDPENAEATIQQAVILAQSLVRFTSKKDHAAKRYAVCQQKALGQGIEGAVYLSTGTVKLAADGDFNIVYKPKRQGKSRVVKQLMPPRDKSGAIQKRTDGSLFDARSQNEKAMREGLFLNQMSLFSAKPAIVTEDDSRAALVMRRVAGKELIDYLVEDGGLFRRGKYVSGTGNIFNVQQRLELTILVGEAILNHVHANGIVHRDIKPENVIVNIDENYNPLSAAVVDFGLAKWSGEEGITEDVGSEGYVSPEVYAGGHAVEKSDAYAFAVIMKDILWQCMGDKRYSDLSGSQKQRITSVLSRGVEDKVNARASLDEIVATFKTIKEECRPASSSMQYKH